MFCCNETFLARCSSALWACLCQERWVMFGCLSQWQMQWLQTSTRVPGMLWPVVKRFQQISGSFWICSFPLSSSLHCLVLIKRKLEKVGVSLLAMQWVVRENLSVPSASLLLYVFSCCPVGVLYFCIIKLTSALYWEHCYKKCRKMPSVTGPSDLLWRNLV